MKILIVVDDYLPKSTKIASKMMHDLATHYVKLGHIVSVITPDVEIQSSIETDIIDKVDIYRFKSGKIKIDNKIRRAINESLLSMNAWKRLKAVIFNIDADLVIYYSPSIFFGPLIKKIKKKLNIPSYLVLRDFFPQWVIDNGMISSTSLITKYFRYFERINYAAADVIGVQSPKNLEWFDQNTNTGKKLELLYNWASLKESGSRKAKFREIYNLGDKVVFFYGGNIGKAQDLMSIVRLAESLQLKEEAYFLIVGSGEDYARIENEIKKKELRNISIYPSIPQDEFQYLLSEIDIGLFTLDYNHNTHNFPGKLLGYMVESKPILGCVNPGNDLKDVIEENSSGFISITGQDSILVKNAEELIDNKKMRIEMGDNSRLLLNKYFSIEAATSQILKALFGKA